MITRAVIWAAVLAGAVLAPSSAHAGIWTPIASGTTEQINAVDYQSPTRFWYATTNGTIGHRKPDGTFGTGAGPAVGVIFKRHRLQRPLGERHHRLHHRQQVEHPEVGQRRDELRRGQQ